MEFDIIKMIQPELIILVVVIYGLGMFLKKIPNFPDWAIPLTLLIISIALTVIYMAVVLDKAFCAVTIVNGVVYGIIIATTAVFTNQLIKQVTVNRVREDD